MSRPDDDHASDADVRRGVAMFFTTLVSVAFLIGLAVGHVLAIGFPQ